MLNYLSVVYRRVEETSDEQIAFLFQLRDDKARDALMKVFGMNFRTAGHFYDGVVYKYFLMSRMQTLEFPLFEVSIQPSDSKSYQERT